MGAFLHKRRGFPAICLLALLLLAFTVKTAIPVGFMPGQGEGGMMALVICSGMGEKTILVPADSAPSPGKENASSDPCAYHLAAMQKNTVSAPPVLPLPASQPIDAAPAAPAANLSTPVLLAAAPRGPPLSSVLL